MEATKLRGGPYSFPAYSRYERYCKEQGRTHNLQMIKKHIEEAGFAWKSVEQIDELENSIKKENAKAPQI